jgi:hypothetical protein
VEEHRRPRDRRRRVHRLIQPPPPARRDRPAPARRVRGLPLPSQPRPDTRRSVSAEPPLNPARDRRPPRQAAPDHGHRSRRSSAGGPGAAPVHPPARPDAVWVADFERHEAPGRTESSPDNDNDGTGQHCQMVRVRQAGQEGVREEPVS